MFQTKFVAKIKTRLFSTTFSLENRTLYAIMWKNIVQPDRQQMTMWRVRIPYWIPEATDTHSEYVMFIPFPWQHWLR